MISHRHRAADFLRADDEFIEIGEFVGDFFSLFAFRDVIAAFGFFSGGLARSA